MSKEQEFPLALLPPTAVIVHMPSKRKTRTRNPVVALAVMTVTATLAASLHCGGWRAVFVGTPRNVRAAGGGLGERAISPNSYRRRNSESSSSTTATTNHNVILPPYLEQNLGDVAEPVVHTTDTPIFWHVPKAGGTTMEFFVSCLGLVQASQVGAAARFGHDQDDELTIFQAWDGYNVVNVDTATPQGLERAKHMGLAGSGLADVVFTGYVHEAARIFDSVHRGRMFTLLRHPVDRAASMFYYLEDAEWESTYSPETKGWTVQQYARSVYPDKDWMVRMLVNNFHTDLHQRDLDLAKEMLQKKFVVGLMSKMEESVGRFERYFNLANDGSGKKEECTQTMLQPGEGSNRHSHPKVEPDSDDWKALAKLNYWDIQLYDFAVALFEEQASLVEDVEDAT